MIKEAKVSQDIKPEVIKMRDMKPMDVGVVVQKGSSYRDHIVMRTQSEDSFEVMDLTDPEEGNGWTGNKESLRDEVQLFPKGTEIVITIR